MSVYGWTTYYYIVIAIMFIPLIIHALPSIDPTQVLALCLLIAASTAENRVGEFQAPGQDLPLVSEGATQASAGWLLFLSVIALFYELALILLRFININVLNNNILILIIVVSI